jgi:uncharacterized membrane protein YqhA
MFFFIFDILGLLKGNKLILEVLESLHKLMVGQVIVLMIGGFLQN